MGEWRRSPLPTLRYSIPSLTQRPATLPALTLRASKGLPLARTSAHRAPFDALGVSAAALRVCAPAAA